MNLFTVSNQLYVLLIFRFQGTQINFRMLFLYEIQHESSHVVIRFHILLHTLQNENLGRTNLSDYLVKIREFSIILRVIKIFVYLITKPKFEFI